MTATAALCVLFTLATPAPADKAPALVKGWAVLMQAMRSVEKYVATGELSAIHNEDTMLSSALSVLRNETKLPSADKQNELGRVLAALGRQIGDLHQAADAFDAAESGVRLAKLRATYAELQHLYGEEVLRPARRLAEIWACPMHREVQGKSGDACPKCGMALDQPVRIPLFFSGGVPAEHTVRARIRTEGPLEIGNEVKGTLHLEQLTGAPLLITDLRVVHTQRIHLLVIDPSLTDYHHIHPQPTAKPGDYTFSFTPGKPGPYRAWADLRTTYGGFQEYAVADIPAGAPPSPPADRRVTLRSELEGLVFALTLDKRRLRTGEPIRAQLRVTDGQGKPFRGLEPIMATFAHLVAFNEDWKTVLHLHPKGTKIPLPTDRGGPDLEFQVYATAPGFYRLFAQVQINGVSKFVPFGLTIERGR
jgi:hypothetical protein